MRAERLSQRRLSSELRAAIDIAARRPSSTSYGLVRLLLDDHPIGSKSSHVQHNLGARRLRWLEGNKESIYG